MRPPRCLYGTFPIFSIAVIRPHTARAYYGFIDVGCLLSNLARGKRSFLAIDLTFCVFLFKMSTMHQEPPTRNVAKSFVHVVYQDILRAAQILSGIACRTPVFTSQYVNKRLGAEVFFKCENLQHSGSFKFRGAYGAIASLDEMQRRLGVIANSSGNHARAVAFAAQLLKVPAMIVLPTRTSEADTVAVRECGVEMFLHESQENKKAIITDFVDKFGWTIIPSVDHQDVIAGYGTVVKELIEEVGALDYLFVPVKEGGLLYGSAIGVAHLLPDCAIIGVEYQKRSELTAYSKYAREIVMVNDSQACAQMRFFSEHANFIVEPFGCLGAAAVSDRVVDIAGARVGVIISGGNIDALTFRRYIASTTMRIVQ
jgi:threonine dehydratase